MNQKLTLILLLFVISCKDEHIDEVSPKYPVEFTIRNIRSDLPVIKSSSVFNSADSLLNKLNVLYYLVFDATGKFVHQKKQLKEEGAFGLITDELKVGQYTVVALSSTDEMNVGATFTTIAATKIKSTAKSGDIFYKRLTIDVTTQGVTQSVDLDRIIGCVQLKIIDRIAENITKIEFQIENEAPYLNIGKDMVDVTNLEARSTSADVNASNRSSFASGLLILNDQLPLTAVVNFLDASNKVVKTRKITGIQNIRGTKISLEGKLSDFMSAGFTIRYNDSWPLDSTIINF